MVPSEGKAITFKNIIQHYCSSSLIITLSLFPLKRISPSKSISFYFLAAFKDPINDSIIYSVSKKVLHKKFI